MFQLKPPEGTYVFQDDHRFPMPVHIWRNYFLCFNLAQNFRAQKDPAFKALLQRAGVGILTDNDKEVLKSRTGLIPPGDTIRLRARRKDVKRFNQENVFVINSKRKFEAEYYVLRQREWKFDPHHAFAWEEEK